MLPAFPDFFATFAVQDFCRRRDKTNLFTAKDAKDSAKVAKETNPIEGSQGVSYGRLAVGIRSACLYNHLTKQSDHPF
jgi:hypothetical protein